MKDLIYTHPSNKVCSGGDASTLSGYTYSQIISNASSSGLSWRTLGSGSSSSISGAGDNEHTYHTLFTVNISTLKNAGFYEISATFSSTLDRYCIIGLSIGNILSGTECLFHGVENGSARQVGTVSVYDDSVELSNFGSFTSRDNTVTFQVYHGGDPGGYARASNVVLKIV